MIVYDLNGEALQVTVLMQADDYRHYRLSGKRNMAFVAKQQAYWENLYQKC